MVGLVTQTMYDNYTSSFFSSLFYIHSLFENFNGYTKCKHEGRQAKCLSIITKRNVINGRKMENENALTYKSNLKPNWWNGIRDRLID